MRRVVGLVGLQQRAIAPLVRAEAAGDDDRAQDRERDLPERRDGELGVLPGHDVDAQPRALLPGRGPCGPLGQRVREREAVERAQRAREPRQVVAERLRLAVHHADRLVHPGRRIGPRHRPRAAPHER